MPIKLVDGELIEYSNEEHSEFLETLPSTPIGLEDYRRAIQMHVETTARSRGYDSAISCASYTGSSVPQWMEESNVFVAWRDAVWLHVFTEMKKVQDGVRTQPTIEELITELPNIAWPPEE